MSLRVLGGPSIANEGHLLHKPKLKPKVGLVVAHDGGWRGGVEVRRRDVFGV